MALAAVGHGARPPAPPGRCGTAYGPSYEFYPVTAARATALLEAWGTDHYRSSLDRRRSYGRDGGGDDDNDIIIAWDPAFRGARHAPEALLWSYGHRHCDTGARYWSVTALLRNPTSRWQQADLFHRQPMRLLQGLLDIADDANATLDLAALAPTEPVLWLESVWRCKDAKR